jgi:adenylate kinase family enzyme
MERILVLGNAGAGKSHLAAALGERLGLDVVHLDRLFWRPGWVERGREEFIELQRRALPRDGRWIADGNYVNTLDVRLPLADTVIVLDMPTVTCLRRVVARTIATTTRPDMAPGCEERLLRPGYGRFLRYVARYRSKLLPRVLARIGEIDHRARVVVLRRDAEVGRFISGAISGYSGP